LITRNSKNNKRQTDFAKYHGNNVSYVKESVKEEIAIANGVENKS